jgi:hypothetical protein
MPSTGQGIQILLRMFFFTSIFVLILVLFYSGEVYFNLLVAGLSLLFCSLLLTSTQILSNNNDNSFKNTIISIFPILLTLSSAAIFMYLLVKYKNIIIGICNITNNNNILNSTSTVNECISPEYQKFSFITILLLIIQMIIVYNSTTSPEFLYNGKQDRSMYAVLFLIGLINLLVMIPLHTIVTYFTADG